MQFIRQSLLNTTSEVKVSRIFTTPTWIQSLKVIFEIWCNLESPLAKWFYNIPLDLEISYFLIFCSIFKFKSEEEKNNFYRCPLEPSAKWHCRAANLAKFSFSPIFCIHLEQNIRNSEISCSCGVWNWFKSRYRFEFMVAVCRVRKKSPKPLEICICESILANFWYPWRQTVSKDIKGLSK